MKPKDVFSLMIRFFGLIFLYQGLLPVPSAVASFFQMPASLWFRNLLALLLGMAWTLAIGVWLVRGAPLLVRLAYGAEEQERGGA